MIIWCLLAYWRVNLWRNARDFLAAWTSLTILAGILIHDRHFEYSSPRSDQDFVAFEYEWMLAICGATIGVSIIFFVMDLANSWAMLAAAAQKRGLKPREFFATSDYNNNKEAIFKRTSKEKRWL